MEIDNTTSVQEPVIPRNLEVVRYNERSCAVYGDTFLWKEDLTALGGKFNNKLRDGAGWIYGLRSEEAVTNFVQRVNASELQPGEFAEIKRNSRPAQTYQQTSIVPIDQIRSITPSSALQRLQSHVQNAPVRTVAAPLPSRSQQLSFPNRYTAGDGLSYQVLVYTVPLPTVGQRITLVVQVTNKETKEVTEHKHAYLVSEIETEACDSIVITRADDATSATRAAVTCGEWQIKGMQGKHQVLFH